MAGDDFSFLNPEEFRADIRAAMTMAIPNDVGMPTFHFNPQRVFAEADDSGSPFDWTADPATDNTKDDVQVLCLIEQNSGLGSGATVNETPAGSFVGNRLTLTFFEDEWAQVYDFTSVTIGPVVYKRIRRLPTQTLYSVDMFVVEVRADDA